MSGRCGLRLHGHCRIVCLRLSGAVLGQRRFLRGKNRAAEALVVVEGQATTATMEILEEATSSNDQEVSQVGGSCQSAACVSNRWRSRRCLFSFPRRWAGGGVFCSFH